MAFRVSSGDWLDGFQVGEHIHAGAMGDIFRVTGEEIDFPLIAKVPRVDTDRGMEGLLAFETEAMILPVIRGACFPRFVRAGDLAANPYLILEWVEGTSLASLMAGGAMSPPDVARVGACIANALHSLHQQDIIHLDLKPDNVILRPDGRACLIDFGLAHHRRFPDLLAEERRFTAGSSPYVSPEQIKGSRSFPQSDLFALGVVLYEMATGQLPFGTPESMAALRDRLWLEPIPPRTHKPDVPPWLQEIVLRCLEPDMGVRYQSAAHVAIDLRQPEQVRLTARAGRSRRAGALAQAARWWNARRNPLDTLPPHPDDVASATVILAAIDTSHLADVRHSALRNVVSGLLRQSKEFRLICVSIIEGGPGLHTQNAATGMSAQHEHLIRLRHWVDPLKLPAYQLSLHVLEAANAADALVDFARENDVDLIAIGAPAPDHAIMAWWRSAASGVTSKAHCSVYVVRTDAAE